MKKLLLGASIACVCLLTSCDKDTSDGGSTVAETTVAQDKANITTSLEEVVTCLGKMKNGSMMNSIVAFTGLSEGEALKDEFIESIFWKMEEAVDTVNTPIEERFNFGSFTGTWSYNSADSSWTRISTPTDQIIVQFPSDDTQLENNAELVLKGYTDEKLLVDNEDVYLPKTFEFSVTKDGTKIAGANLINIVYEQSNDIPVPISVNASIFMSPFTFKIEGERETANKYVAGIEFGNGSGCGYSMDAELNLAHNDYENLDEEDFLDLKGKVAHNDLVIDYFFNLKKLNELDNDNDDLTTAEFNNNTDVKVLYKSAKIADIIVVDVDNDTEVFVQYKDGTKENTSVHYEQLGEDLEALFSDLTGSWYEDEEEIQ